MLWQYLLVTVIILAAATFLVRQTWRTWFGAKDGCGGGCHCAGNKRNSKSRATGSAVPVISVDELTARIRNRS
jgi:hypothetical protein